MVGNVAVLLVLVLARWAQVCGDVKRLRYDTAWNNGDNWSEGRPPSADDVVLMGAAWGARADAAVALPVRANVRMRALLLPRQGALLLPRDGAFVVLGSAADATRTATVNRFLRTEALDWLDPASWVSSSPPSLDDGDGMAVPHAERVPCRFDHVQLPSNASFALRLPPLALAVAGVRVGALSLTPDGWLLFVEGIAPAFVVPGGVGGEVRVEPGVCLESAGCSCVAPPRSRAAAVEERVCAHVRPRCESDGPPPCLSPVRPHGHCCHVCGAFLVLSVERGLFRLGVLREAVRTLTRDRPALVAHISRLPDHRERVQVVLMERGSYQGESVTAAMDLRASIVKDATLGVSSVSVAMSGPAIAQASWVRVAAPAFGSLAAAVAVIAAIFLIFSGWQTLMPSNTEEGGSFVFARFENTEAESEAVQVVANPPGSSQAFDNPLYKQKDGEKSQSNVQYSNLQEEELQKFSELQEETDVS